jgi:hypothetical protein
MFTEIDTSDDRRVDVDEFASAVERLGMWGVRVDDPVAEFNRIDRNKVRECPCVPYESCIPCTANGNDVMLTLLVQLTQVLKFFTLNVYSTYSSTQV